MCWLFFHNVQLNLLLRAQNLVPLLWVVPCELEAAVGLGRNQLLDCAGRLQLKRLSHSSNPVLKMMWPEGKLSITEVTKRPLTAATLFKNSMIALVDNLTLKVKIPVSKLTLTSDKKSVASPWRESHLPITATYQELSCSEAEGPCLCQTSSWLGRSQGGSPPSPMKVDFWFPHEKCIFHS